VLNVGYIEKYIGNTLKVLKCGLKKDGEDTLERIWNRYLRVT
jgi:hypothetical protein